MTIAMPAATLILFRDRADAAAEILMVERGRQLVFAGGAMVFPGGRVDPGDAVIATDPALIIAGASLDADDLIARITAVRETIEEAGLAPAVDGLADAGAAVRLRGAMLNGASFGDMLRDMDLRIDPYRLHPFARWLPTLHANRIFDTRFYIARAPEHDEAIADGSETASCHWDTAAGHFAMVDAGERSMIFPTRRNLERAALSATFDAAVDFARRYAIETISPWIEERDGERWLCIPEHLGYPNTAERLSSAMPG